MADEGQVLPEEVVITTPDTTGTAPVVEAPASGEVTPVDKPVKTFSQEELDAEIGKRLAKAERKWKREQQPSPTQEPSTAQASATDGEPVKPDITKFTEQAAYDAALETWADKKAEFREAKKAKETAAQQEQRAFQEILHSHEEREEAARDKYADYEQVAYNPKLPITEPMAAALRLSDIGPDIAYHLGKPENLKEVERIAKLHPIAQAKEIGKLEAKLIAEPPAKKTSSAPEPINPLTPRGGVAYTNLDDPKALKQLGTSGIIAAWEAEARAQARQGK